VAIVTGPLHSSEARGAVGALVYNSWHGRCYVKARSTPKTEYSDLQVDTRALMVPIIAAWRLRSDAQRAAWAQFADTHLFPHWTGTDKRLSAWNWFAKVNYRLNFCSQPMRDDPPDRSTAYIPYGLAIHSEGTDIFVDWARASPPPDPAWLFLFWASAEHAVTVHPAFNMTLWQAYAPEQQAAILFTVPAAGWITVYVEPLSLQGISMPPTRLLVEAT